MCLLSKKRHVEMFLFVRESNLKTMSGRIQHMRRLLYEGLKKSNTPGDWTHIVNQIGMFAYTGLTGKNLRRLLFLK
jgi:aspartate aminotransferase